MEERYGGCGGRGRVNDKLATFPPNAPSGLQHVAIDVTLGTAGPVGPAHVRVQITNQSGTAVDVDQAITAYDVPPSRIEVSLGAPGSSQNTGAWAIRYDNFLIDIP